MAAPARPSLTLPSRVSVKAAEQPPTPQQPADAPGPAAAPADAKPAAPEVKAPLLQKGQGTAIVTGAISAILGIGYLALVWLLDSRGGQMQPPPPEAFLP